MTFSEWAKDKYPDHTLSIHGKKSDSSRLQRWYPIGGPKDGQCWNVDWQWIYKMAVVTECDVDSPEELWLHTSLGDFERYSNLLIEL